MKNNKLETTMQVTGALLSGIAVIVQFVIMINNRTEGAAETIVRFFSYFTILTNILVAVSFISLLNILGDKWKIFFSNMRHFTAITVYIVVVGIIYNTILRWLWAPQGLQKLVDEMLHLIVPLFTVFYWSIFVPKESTPWQAFFKWLLYPLFYCIYVLIRGSFVNWYPYPFLEVQHLGYSKVLLNCVFVTISFLFVTILLVSIGKRFSSKNAV